MSEVETKQPAAAEEADAHADKKAKMTVPMAPDDHWPDAWVMCDKVDNQCSENRLEPNVKVTAEQLKKLGVFYWKLDAESYEYPVKAVPWDPKEAMDPKLKALRDDRGYGYADIITVHPDHLPEFESKIAMFFEEHIHDAEEIRYILGGSGYFDVRDDDDKWIRVHVKKGDFMTLPEGIYHSTFWLALTAPNKKLHDALLFQKIFPNNYFLVVSMSCSLVACTFAIFIFFNQNKGFTCDEGHMCHAMRLFKGHPIWTPFNRPQEDHPSRQKYVKEFLEEKKNEED